MKRLLLSPVLLILALGAARSAYAGAQDPSRASDRPTELLIDLVDDASPAHVAEVEARLGRPIHPNSAFSEQHERLYLADATPEEMETLEGKLAGDPNVEGVEANAIYHASMVPNDPLWEKQWSFQMIDAPRAWDLADGSGVTVAVIDTGVAYEDFQKFRQVEDLQGVEFVQGYDFTDDDDHANDDHGHGTHVAGTIAQATNNGIGVAGLAFHAKIMPLKVLSKRGMGTAADISDAIRFAADEGAQVINMSLGGGGRSAAMQSAVAYARKKGLIVVSAAGNAAHGRVEFPAAYPGAFAVSAVGPDRQLAYYSSWGKELAIAAPGGDRQKGDEGAMIVQNTIMPNAVGKTDLYLAFQGTSMATPHVAGAAALVISAGVTNPDQVEAILRATADRTGSSDDESWSERYGSGVLNVGRAVEAARETSGGKWHLAAGLALLGGVLLRRKRSLAFAVTAVLGTALAASGLGVVPPLGSALAQVPGLRLLAEPMTLWDETVLGAGWHFTALWASVLPLAFLTVLLLSVRSARGLLTGLAVGWAVQLAAAAWLVPCDVLWIPGLAGGFDRVWLVAQALLTVGLAFKIAQVDQRTGTAH